MKIRFTSLASYSIGKYNLNYGDIIDDDGALLKQFPAMFELVAEEQEKKEQVNFESMTIADLQKFAKQHSIVIDKYRNKKELINNIKKAIDE